MSLASMAGLESEVASHGRNVVPISFVPSEFPRRGVPHNTKRCLCAGKRRLTWTTTAGQFIKRVAVCCEILQHFFSVDNTGGFELGEALVYVFAKVRFRVRLLWPFSCCTRPALPLPQDCRAWYTGHRISSASPLIFASSPPRFMAWKRTARRSSQIKRHPL